VDISLVSELANDSTLAEVKELNDTAVELVVDMALKVELLKDDTADVLREISLVNEFANDSTLAEVKELKEDTADVLREISLVNEFANDSTLAEVKELKEDTADVLSCSRVGGCYGC
jgi:hypothetical protein